MTGSLKCTIYYLSVLLLVVVRVDQMVQKSTKRNSRAERERERKRDGDKVSYSLNVQMRKERRTDAQCDIKWENHHEKEH